MLNSTIPPRIHDKNRSIVAEGFPAEFVIVKAGDYIQRIMKLTSRPIIIIIIITIIMVVVGVWLRPAVQPIRIGVLHSLSGTMEKNERPLVDAVRLAVEEINAAGGILGRPVEMLVADGRSDDAVFASEAERLITAEKISALFACWTSSCRKAVKPVVEKHQHLLFYPLPYEGMEQSPNIYYTGTVPNQQIIPGTRWALDKLGRRVYLLGSDYIFPRTANLIIRDMVKANGGHVLAERYQALGGSDFGAIIAELRQLKPDVVLSTINGDSNIHFFRALHKAGMGELPVMSYGVAEVGLQAIAAEDFHPNHYAVWSYFQSLQSAANRRFVADLKARFGAERVISDPMEASYTSVHLWAQAVRDADTDEVQRVNSAMMQQSMAAPSGIAAIDQRTRHMWKNVYVGRARSDNQFDLLWSSGETLRPDPYPDYRPVHEWQQLLEKISGARP